MERQEAPGRRRAVWQDEQNFFRLLRAANGETNRLFVSAELYHDGKFAGGRDVAAEDQPTYLRVERRMGRFTFSMSSDDRTWVRLPTPELEMTESLQVGIAAINSTTSVISPQFDGFQLLTDRSR